MSRQQRRALASIDRREAKTPHPTQSFEKLVGDANRNALKPFIIEVVEEMGQGLRQEIARMILDENARLQTRLVVLEQVLMEKLGETEATLAERILSVEDEATGHAKAEVAEAGDLLRVTLQVRPETGDPEKFSAPQNLILRKLAVAPNPTVESQTYKDMEQALIGAKAGETREVSVKINPAAEDGGPTYVFKVKVDRVSRPIKAEVPAPVATEGTDASS